MNIRHVKYALLLPLALLLATAPQAGAAADKSLARGRYLVMVGGCNDCHTAGYPEAAGHIQERDWLTGNQVGFKGPWGTSYPANLRLLIQSMTETAWLKQARAERRPPMPWYNLRAMSDPDLRAIYRYIHSLGGKGRPSPAYVPPGQMVNTPYIDFMPKNLPKQARAK